MPLQIAEVGLSSLYSSVSYSRVSGLNIANVEYKFVFSKRNEIIFVAHVVLRDQD